MKRVFFVTDRGTIFIESKYTLADSRATAWFNEEMTFFQVWFVHARRYESMTKHELRNLLKSTKGCEIIKGELVKGWC